MSDTTQSGFRETDIRPDEFRVKEAELFEQDIRALLDKKERFVRVPCPACNSERSEPVFEKYGQSFELCGACETLFVNPRPTAEILEEYYASSTYYRYWNDVIFPHSEPTRRDKIFRPRAERMASILAGLEVPTRTLLEVGAGFGTFCEEVTKLALFERIVAVEPTPDLAASCRKRGVEVIAQPVETVELGDEPIDVVASFEVIEHLFAPSDFIGHCARLLPSGGLLVLTCPNVKGFDVMILRELSDVVEPEHLNYFHPASLSQLVERHGFEVLEVSTPGKLDAELVRKKALAGELDLSAQPFLERVLLEEWERVGDEFQTFLADNGLSSHLWLVARKLT